MTGAACALLLAVPAAWYLRSPWWTLWRMREAARAGDMGTLASYVDLDAVREGGTWAQVLRSEWHRRLDAGADSLRSVMADIPFARRDLLGGPAGLNPLIVHRSFDEFTVGVGKTPSPGTFTFRRHGLGC